jgi:hypothetical protein
MSEARSFRSRMKRKWERLMTRREYMRARRLSRRSGASALPDDDLGVHIRGPAIIYGGNRAEDTADNPVDTGFGRRHTDILADKLITKKLVVVAVVVVEVLCLAGDTLFLRGTSCP